MTHLYPQFRETKLLKVEEGKESWFKTATSFVWCATLCGSHVCLHPFAESEWSVPVRTITIRCAPLSTLPLDLRRESIPLLRRHAAPSSCRILPRLAGKSATKEEAEDGRECARGVIHDLVNSQREVGQVVRGGDDDAQDVAVDNDGLADKGDQQEDGRGEVHYVGLALLLEDLVGRLDNLHHARHGLGKQQRQQRRQRQRVD